MKIGNLKIKKTVAVFMCIMLFTLSTGCSELEGLNIDTSAFFSDPVTQVIEAVNLSEYSTANEIYNEKISGNLELEKEVESQLSEIISEAIDSYNNGEITYDDVAIILETIECAGIYNYTSLLNSYTELENLQESKNYYEEAVLLEGDGEYLEAHNVYSQVSSDDTNYESAQTKSEEVLETLLEKLIAEANEAVADSNYEYALYTMDSYSAIFSDSDAYWREIDYICYTCMDEIITDAEALVAEGSYSEAYDVLFNKYELFNFEGEDLYDAEVTKVYSLWEAAVLDEAEEAFGTYKDYEAAILVLQRSGLTGNTIDSEIAKYQEYIPVALTSLEYINKGNGESVGTSLSSIYTDVQKNVYDKSGIIYQWSFSSNDDIIKLSIDVALYYIWGNII